MFKKIIPNYTKWTPLAGYLCDSCEFIIQARVNRDNGLMEFATTPVNNAWTRGRLSTSHGKIGIAKALDIKVQFDNLILDANK